MSVYSCECGKYRAYGNKAPPPCAYCSTCETQIVSYPDKPEPRPHAWAIRMVETDEGEEELTYCVLCNKSHSYLEAEGGTEVAVEEDE